MTSPCKNCDKREYKCHGRCEDYKAFQKDAKKEHAAEKAFNSESYNREK